MNVLNLEMVELILQQMNFLTCKPEQRILNRNLIYEIKCEKILREKSITAITEHCRKMISGAPNFFLNHEVSLIKVVIVWAPSEKEIIEVHISDKASFAVFNTREFTRKEDLNESRLFRKIWDIF